MPTTHQLPCAHCTKPIDLSLIKFFPSRRHSIVCPSCGRGCHLPLSAVAIGGLTCRSQAERLDH